MNAYQLGDFLSNELLHRLGEDNAKPVVVAVALDIANMRYVARAWFDGMVSVLGPIDVVDVLNGNVSKVAECLNGALKAFNSGTAEKQDTPSDRHWSNAQGGVAFSEACRRK